MIVVLFLLCLVITVTEFYFVFIILFSWNNQVIGRFQVKFFIKISYKRSTNKFVVFKMKKKRKGEPSADSYVIRKL